MGRKAVIFVVFALCLSGIAALDENNRKPAQKGGSAFYGVHQALKPIGPLLKTMRAIVIAILQALNPCLPTGVLDCAAICPQCYKGVSALGDMFKGLDQSLRKLSYKVLAGISKAADSVGKFALDVFRGFKIVVIKIHAALKAVLQVVRNQFERIASALARRKEKNESRGKFGKGETTWDQMDPIRAAKSEAAGKQKMEAERKQKEIEDMEAAAALAAARKAAVEKEEKQETLQAAREAATNAQAALEEMESLEHDAAGQEKQTQ